MSCASKQSCRKSHLSYVCYTSEELLLCVQSQPYISGTVLFQGLLYICSKSSKLRRTCPSRSVHTHTWSVDWMCRGLDFSEKLCAGPHLHSAWPVQMCSTQHIEKFLQRTQLSPCFIGHGLLVRLWSNSSEVKGGKSLSIYSTNYELWLFSQRESWKSEMKPLLKWETTWVQVSTRNLVPVLGLGKPDSQGLESAGLWIRLTALENLYLAAKPCSEKLSIQIWTSSWTPFAFIIIIIFLLTRTITSRITILPTSASYLFIFCLISILESLSPTSLSPFLIGSEAKRTSLSLKAFSACH